MQLLDGKKVSEDIKNEIAAEVAQMKAKGEKVPHLAAIIVGNDGASLTYVGSKVKSCERVGFESTLIKMPSTTSETELLKKIKELNENDDIDGFIVQLPLPKQIDTQKIIEAIDPSKDVDGFHPENVAKLFLGQRSLVPCTPKGMMVLLDEINYDLTGKEVVVVGRSNIVGKPMAMLLLRENGTVTVCHSHTKDLKEVCKRADILVVAIGKPKFIDDSYVKDGAVVIDVGIHRNENNKLCGDVDYDKVAPKTSAITPVPGGVGPMTIAMLMKNCVESKKLFGE